MPYPKKPKALKLITGSRQPDDGRGVDLPPVESIPQPPDWLPNGHAIKEFNRLAPILHNNRLLTDAGLMPLAHLCALHGKILQLYAAGEAPTGALLGQYRALSNDFGLTPVAAGRVSPGGTDKPGNRFSRNGRREL